MPATRSTNQKRRLAIGRQDGTQLDVRGGTGNQSATRASVLSTICRTKYNKYNTMLPAEMGRFSGTRPIRFDAVS